MGESILQSHAPVEYEDGNALTIREATIDDLPDLRTIEREAFGVNVLPTIHDQVIAGAGREYIAIHNGTPAGYVTLVFEPLDQDKIDAQALDYTFKRQEKYMAGHNGFVGDIDWHLIATSRKYAKQGVAKKMLDFIKADLEKRDPTKKIWSALIRSNNPQSMRRAIRTLGMTGLYVQGENIRGDMPYHLNFHDRSYDTNIVFTNLVPAKEPTEFKLSKQNIWSGKRKPKGNLLLLPIRQGEEGDITDADREKLKYLMAVGTIPDHTKNFGLINIFTAKELESFGINSVKEDKFYLLFFRNPDVFKLIPPERVEGMYKYLQRFIPKPGGVPHILRTYSEING